MGLRCLLGHEYANREVEREREERGDEVVVTYRTVETCDRCGERRVVSENKEVRPIRNPRDDDVTTGLGGGGGGGGEVTPDLGGPAAEDDVSADSGPAPDAEDAPPADTESTSPATADGDPTVADPGATDDDAGTAVDADAGTDADPTPDPDEEDAVILEDGAAGDDDRARGEWHGTDDEASTTGEGTGEREADPDPVDDGTTVVSGDEGWPDPQGDDEGFDAGPSDGESADVSFGGGLTPERSDTADEAGGGAEAATNGTTSAVADKQFVSAEGVERVGEKSTGETEFFCPNCGYARVAGGSSMRAGDICPDCHKGYIAERDR
jgi:hypothetical protein